MFEKVIKQTNQSENENKIQLARLLETPYAASPEQLKQLNTLVENFEAKAHRFFWYNCMERTGVIYMDTLFMRWFIPTPQLITNFLDSTFFISLVGHHLKKNQIKSLSQEVKEMQVVFAWITKNPDSIKLNHQVIPRLMLCLVPFCDKKDLSFFLPKEKRKANSQSDNLSYRQKIANYFFSAPPAQSSEIKAPEPIDEVRELLKSLASDNYQSLYSKVAIASLLHLPQRIIYTAKDLVVHMMSANVELFTSAWKKYSTENKNNSELSNLNLKM